MLLVKSLLLLLPLIGLNVACVYLFDVFLFSSFCQRLFFVFLLGVCVCAMSECVCCCALGSPSKWALPLPDAHTHTQCTVALRPSCELNAWCSHYSPLYLSQWVYFLHEFIKFVCYVGRRCCCLIFAGCFAYLAVTLRWMPLDLLLLSEWVSECVKTRKCDKTQPDSILQMIDRPTELSSPLSAVVQAHSRNLALSLSLTYIFLSTCTRLDQKLNDYYHNIGRHIKYT